MKTDQEILDAALKKAKSIAKGVAREVDQFETENQPVSIFMSGSPGAGKTEFSKRYIESILPDPAPSIRKNNFFMSQGPLRIDSDDYRPRLDGYNGANSHLFQKAASIIVSAVHDRALKKNVSFLLDSTFSSEEKAAENIQRSLKRNRKVQVIYVYQEPVTAWRFVQKRERVEGRRIRRDDFARIFCDAPIVANEMKKRFGKELTLSLVIKDIDDPRKFKMGISIERIGDYLPRKYTQEEILEIISASPE